VVSIEALYAQRPFHTTLKQSETEKTTDKKGKSET